MASLAALDDDSLAERAAQGDGEALELLLVRFAPVGVRVAYGILGRREDALDATQSALIQVASQIQTRWSGNSFRAWFCACAHGAAVNLALQNKSRKQRERRAAQDTPTASAHPDSLLERKETLAALREEIAKLPRDTGQLLGLHHLEDIPISDLAAQMGLSEEACWQRLSRGRDDLRRRLERRGVALASAALIAELLAEMASSAKARAAEAGEESLQHMATSARGVSNVESNLGMAPGKALISYSVVAALLLLLVALAPLYLKMPDDPLRRRRFSRPPAAAVQPVPAPERTEPKGDDF